MGDGGLVLCLMSYVLCLMSFNCTSGPLPLARGGLGWGPGASGDSLRDSSAYRASRAMGGWESPSDTPFGCQRSIKTRTLKGGGSQDGASPARAKTENRLLPTRFGMTWRFPTG